MERLLSANAVLDYRLDVYSKNNDVYIFEYSLDEPQFKSSYNIKITVMLL